jgi:hypothetical protein
MKFNVRQGNVHVNAIWRIQETPTTAVFHADLRAKYAQVTALSGVEVYVSAGEGTLHRESGEAPTVVELVDLPEGWTLYAYVSRYTLYIFAYQVDGVEGEVVWSDGE